MSRVLVVSPHPDDEAVGCGGSLKAHAERGDRVRVVFLTSGEQGGHGMPPAEAAGLREAEAAEAAPLLGIESFDFWRAPDGALRAARPLVERLRDGVEEWNPDVLYVTHDREAHADHRAAARLVRQALAAVPERRRPEVLMFEVWTPLGRIDRVTDITPWLEARQAAIRAYRSQCAVMRFEEAFRGLARYRGEMFCWPKAEEQGTGRYAEVFALMEP